MVSEVAPVVDEHERERRFPIEIVAPDRRAGLARHPDPRGRGRRRASTRWPTPIAIEEIGRVWGSLGLIVAAHTSLGCGPLHLAGSHGAEAALSSCPMARGEVIGGVRADRARCRQRFGRDADDGARTRTDRTAAPGSSTAASGSSPTPGRPAPTSSRPGPATRDDGSAEISAFIVPADTPGFSVGRLEEKLGLHASATGELVCSTARGCRPANLLGERGERLPDVPQDPRRRPDQHRGAGRRARPGRARRVHPVCPDPRAVRPPDRLVPGRRVHDRRHGHRDRGRPRARLARRLAQGPGPRLRARRGAGQAVRLRGRARAPRTTPSRSTVATAT